MTALDQRQQV